jgi:hypothetical protein
MNNYEQTTQEVRDAFQSLCKGRVEAAVKAEREACAKLAATTVCDIHIPTGIKVYGTVAAKAIRARTTNEH